MARKGPLVARKVKPDPIYNDIMVTKLINGIMYGGKKSVAAREVYNAFKLIKKETKRTGRATRKKFTPLAFMAVISLF